MNAYAYPFHCLSVLMHAPKKGHSRSQTVRSHKEGGKHTGDSVGGGCNLDSLAKRDLTSRRASADEIVGLARVIAEGRGHMPTSVQSKCTPPFEQISSRLIDTSWKRPLQRRKDLEHRLQRSKQVHKTNLRHPNVMVIVVLCLRSKAPALATRGVTYRFAI